MTSVTEICIDLIVSGLQSNTGLNPNGGDIVVIDGSGFPTDPNDAEVILPGGGICLVLTSTSVQITCQAGLSPGTGPFNLVVNVNQQTSTAPDQVLFDGNGYGALGVNPRCVNPILEQEIVIILDAFPILQLSRELFDATLVSTDPNSDYTPTPLYVMAADPMSLAIQIKFPGAPTGEYEILLTH